MANEPLHEGAGYAHGTAENVHQMCISIVPIFNHLGDDELREIVGSTVPLKYTRGETIYSAGERSDRLYIVHQGRVKIYRLSENGKEQLVRILGPGDFIGELAVFQTTVHDSYAEALEKTEICSLGRDDLQRFLLKYPSISLRLMNEFARRLDESEKQAASFATEPVDTRVAMYLAELADTAAANPIRLPMTRKDLASHLGTTPETISRKFADFEDAGWIRQLGQKEIEILDMDALLLH
ncbi:Crp/Fnr family transcriptional regulator [Bhargavaea ullalensis]|uniref:CRP/FNR family transcriptional regulator n=1 Tax=Bhargavaea ullalensis TaxID=1265685 RepID=A0ABV2G892_9BACL